MLWFGSSIHKPRVIPVFFALSSTVLRPESTFAKKTGMTVVGVVCNERR
ncbi:MAG: hypothetical protein BWX80_00506 [Candidatus Hydrogenedentes bacterium ADurb.Bin101]|nr:MAG: hypothetical protein BWX80_00506 [Candidatus Hydrogenedentes bacterium ADurb.Bin101]